MDGINTNFPASSATSLLFQENVQPFSINNLAKILFNSSYGGFALLGALSLSSLVLYSIVNAPNKKAQILSDRFLENNGKIQKAFTRLLETQGSLLKQQQQQIKELATRLATLEDRFIVPVKLEKSKKAASTGQIKTRPKGSALGLNFWEFGSRIR